eukprot:TRINITY_DN12753_c0_g1_i1.p1 TRINITY_DN12753_c0_g1~~TRINITY_DN12753_c0_g1_i1.p1  ORF type:complete len:473 (+),score=61.53 TRINITY_DN12753_c0_g1_i1:140-1420(+)
MDNEESAVLFEHWVGNVFEHAFSWPVAKLTGHQLTTALQKYYSNFTDQLTAQLQQQQPSILADACRYCSSSKLARRLMNDKPDEVRSDLTAWISIVYAHTSDSPEVCQDCQQVTSRINLDLYRSMRHCFPAQFSIGISPEHGNRLDPATAAMFLCLDASFPTQLWTEMMQYPTPLEPCQLDNTALVHACRSHAWVAMHCLQLCGTPSTNYQSACNRLAFWRCVAKDADASIYHFPFPLTTLTDNTFGLIPSRTPREQTSALVSAVKQASVYGRVPPDMMQAMLCIRLDLVWWLCNDEDAVIFKDAVTEDDWHLIRTKQAAGENAKIKGSDQPAWQQQLWLCYNLLNQPAASLASLHSCVVEPWLAYHVMQACFANADNEQAWTAVLDEIDYWCNWCRKLSSNNEVKQQFQTLREAVTSAIATCYDV